jgi:PPP family 3-phenylpropionic acid transporter
MILPRVVRQRSTPRAVAIGLYVFAFAAVGAYSPYWPVYFQSLGLPLDAIGVLAAAAALAGLLAAPIWGLLADQVAGSRAVLVASALAAAVCATALGLASLPLVAALIAVRMRSATPGLDRFLTRTRSTRFARTSTATRGSVSGVLRRSSLRRSSSAF